MTEAVSIESQGSQLMVYTRGAGTPLVFLHAAVCDSRMWARQMAHLSNSYRVIAYDRPGFGESPPRTFASSSIADVLNVLDGLGIVEPAVLIGCSQGGRIALETALTHPSKVQALFLIAPALSGAPTPTYTPEIEIMLREQQLAEQAEDWGRFNEIRARLWLDGPLSPAMRVDGDTRRLFLKMNAIAIAHRNQGGEIDKVPVFDQLAGIHAPTRVVWGDLDFPHVQQRAQRISDQVPNGTGVLLPDIAHIPSIECPEKVSELLEQFLTEI